ncbi:MAG TPA: NADH-quinone oxidoreductase subunit K [Ignavibacteria bacterium]|nr:NADH-quinone oxidoreductase subunit K [Ignavibacteria bacterium]HMQ98278.1 NADH-quinone oxidoreductase subunit K [Ignavibacteria bacterium]
MTGINYYIFISALVFGLGLYTLLTAKEAIRVIIALVMLFSASLINIAAFSGFWGFNPEGQLIMFAVTTVCLLNLAAGIVLFVNNFKMYKNNLIKEPDPVE